MSFTSQAVLGFLFGIGFGYFVQRAGLCFAHGFGEIFLGVGKRIFRLFLVVFVVTSLGFLLSSYLSPSLGLKPVGQIRGYGLFNLLAGMVFGAGILMNGGCILGTLRQMGEGNLSFLVVFVSFIPGMALVVYGIDPLLQSHYAVQKKLLPDLFGVAPVWVTAVLVLGALLGLWALRKRSRPRRASVSGV